MDLGISGKVAIVTGGARGIGKAIALRLAEEGSRVVISSRDSNMLRKTVDEIKARGWQATGIHVDVVSPTGGEELVYKAVAELGGIDMVVANAGGGGVSRFMDATAEDWRDTLELNLLYPVRLIKAAIPEMARRGGGAIVLVSSISGRVPGQRTSPDYCVAKAAEIFLAPSLTWQLAPMGIRVNVVSPGSIDHPDSFWARLREDDPSRYATYAEGEFPAGRLDTAEEVANAVAFLLSATASGINGANLAVDGAQAGGLRPTRAAS